MKYILNVSETYRVDTEDEVEVLLNDAKEDPRFILSNYKCQVREQKAKGEVIDTWYKVTLTKTFSEEKDPFDKYRIVYEENE